MNLRSLQADLLRRIEHHARGCCTEQRAARRCGVANGAALVDHPMNRGELAVSSLLCRRYRSGLLGFEALLARAGWHRIGHATLAVRRSDERQTDHADCSSRQCPGEAIAIMTGVEVVTHQHRQYRDAGQDQPVVLAAIGAREVVADHDEQHRQGEVVVVARAQQALGGQQWVRRTVLLDGSDQRTLCRHDDAEHVADHDGADQRAGVDVGRTSAEDLRIGPRSEDHQDEQDQTEQCGLFAKRRVAEQVIDEPADDQRAETDGNSHGRRQITARRDQVERRVEVVDHHQQGHARQPGGVGLPLEPVQVVRHLRRCQLVLFQVVDAAAVNRPEIARQAVAGVGAVKVVFQPDEIERRTDPGDADDHVNPANSKVQPFGQMCFHDNYLLHGWHANRCFFLFDSSQVFRLF